MKVQKLEWESFTWPLQASRIHCVKGLYDIPVDSVVIVSRDQNFKLQATISGTTHNADGLKYRNEGTLGKGMITETEELTCSNRAFEQFRISGVLIKNLQTTMSGMPDNVKYNFNAELILNEIALDDNHFNLETEVVIDFFLSGKVSYLMPRTTHIDYETRYTRTRHDFGEDGEERIAAKGSDNGRNCFYIKTQYFDCIVQIVDATFIPSWANGVLIEYRKGNKNLPDSDVREAVAELVGFILGTRLRRVGTTELDSVDNVISRIAVNPWGDNVVHRSGVYAKSPINLHDYEDWLKLERTINSLLPSYLEHRQKYKLTDVLWKFWIAQEAAIGANLPILSSALETLADAYVEANNLTKTYSKEEKKDYLDTFKDEIDALELKLEAFDFKKRVIDKLRNPFNPAGGEKLKLFYQTLGFSFPYSSLENKALQARNAMAHSSLANDDETIKKYIILSTAYEVVFCRILMRVLGFDEKYLDYCHHEYIERHILENMDKSHL